MPWWEAQPGLAKRFEGISDVHYGDDRHWVCNDGVGVSEWTLTGTSTAGQQIEGPARHGCPRRVFSTATHSPERFHAQP